MTTWNPNLGTKIGPAWQAIRTNLINREHGSRTVAVSIAQKAGGIQQQTAVTVIYDLIRHGYVDKLDSNRIMLTSKGRAS